MKKTVISMIVLIFIFLGCSRVVNNSTNTKVWGMVGSLYEVSKESGNEGYSQGRFSTTLSIEKSFGAVTVGGEIGSK